MARAPVRARPSASAPARGVTAFACAAAAVLPLAVYLATLHPGLAAGDSGELVTVAATGGVAHPPGYPLWTLLGHAWLRVLPWGTPAWRLNLASALAMAAAAAALAWAALRLTRSPAAALAAAWAFALAAPVWKVALVAEVFALNALLAALTLGALVARPSAARVAVLACLAALGVAHHHTLLLLALPALAVATWEALRAKASRGRLAALALGAAVAGALPLAWLPLGAHRAHALAWGDGASFRGLLALLVRADYGTFALAPAAAGLRGDRSELLLFLATLPAVLGVLPLALGALGAPALARRRPAVAVALAAYAALQAAFFARAGLPSDVPWLRGVIERFHVLPLLVLALLAAVGAAWLLAALARRRALRSSVALLLGAACALVPLATRTRALDQRGNTFTITFAHALLAGLPARTVLFVRGDLVHNALAYAQYVEHLRPDVTVLDQELMTYGWYVRRVRAEHPGVLPPLGRAERLVLRDGRVLEGLALPRADGTVDVLTADENRTLPATALAAAVPATPESLFAGSRAAFATGPFAERTEDRYSGLPGTRNLLWLDALAGRRPVAFVGTRDDSWRLRYELASVGLAALAHVRTAPPAVGEQAALALAALDWTPPEVYFRAADPLSFEAAERWRFGALFARGALLVCQPGARAAVAAHPIAHAHLLGFARRFEALADVPDPACLRAIGWLRLLDPPFADRAQARRDFERYAATSEAAARDPEVRAVLAQLGAGAAAPAGR